MASYLKLLGISTSSTLILRNFSKFTQVLHTVYDPKIFIEPIVDYEEVSFGIIILIIYNL